MQVGNGQNFVITQTLVDLQEKKVDKNKPKQFIEFLKAITVQQIQFDSPGCYSKFLQILKKASPSDSALYESTIRFFKNSLGIPENVFEEKVRLRGKNDAQITLSKDLLEIFYPFFKASFASKLKESVASNDGLFEISVPLSQEALKFFKNHVHGQSISSEATVEALKELSYFAGMLEDEKLQNQTSQLIFEWFADDKNAQLFDPEFMADHAPEFTEFYFAKKKIDIKKLETRGFSTKGFSIGLKDFYAQFQEKDSKLLHYLADQIHQITVDAAREGFDPSLHLLPKDYCRAIQAIHIADYKEARRLQPIFPNARIIRQDSITTLRSEITADPRNDYAHVLLGSYLQKTPEGEKELQLALQHNPKNASAFMWLGGVLIRKGNMKDAEVHVRKAIELDPKNAPAHSLLANLQFRNDDFDEAEKSARTAIKFNPKDSKAYYTLGHVLLRKKNFKEAEKAFQRAVELNPKAAEWYLDLARAKVDLNEAKDACYKAIELSPTNASAHAYLGRILYQKGDLDGAEKEIRLAMEHNPHQVEVYYLDLVQILIEKDDHEGIKKICSQVIELNSKNSEAYRQLGRAARIQGSLDEAERAFQKAIELDPNNARLHVGIGRVLQRKGRSDEAEKAYHLALKCNKDSETAHNGLGVCYLKKGELTKAKEELLLALKIQPKYAFARRRLDLIKEPF